MDHNALFLDLLLILISARFLAEFAVRVGVPSVIGELLAGIVLGPSLLGWVAPSETVGLLAEIGIILLLFKVGLETDARRLVHAGPEAVLVAGAGFVAPFILGATAAHAVFGMSLLNSLFIGGTLTATSIGITVRVLADLGHQHGEEGQIVLGAAVLDDVMGVVLLALIYEFSTGGGVSIGNAAKVLLFVGAFFLFAPVAARLVSLVIKRFDSVTLIPGLLPTSFVSLVLFFGWLARVIGAPELLGGFAAGLALSRRFFLPFGIALHRAPVFARGIEEQMKPIIHLFTPIFFVTVGLSLDLQAVDWTSPFIWVFSGALLAAAAVGKLAGALFIRRPWRSRWIVGTAMVPRGEVGLVFAELGRVSGVFDNEVYAAVIIVIALTTLLPPFVMKMLFGRTGRATAPAPQS